MNKTGLAIVALATTAPINASAAEYFAVTPSGVSETHFGEPPSEVIGKLSSMCIDRGFSVTSSTSTEVVCESPLNFGQSVLSQALLGNSYSTPPRRFIKFNVATVRGISRAQASGWIETQMAFGQVRRSELDGSDFHNSVMNLMSMAGGQLPKGTSFPNHAYLGVNWETKQSGKLTHYILSMVTEGHPAHLAGLAVGDQIVSIAGKKVKTGNDLLEITEKAAKTPQYEVQYVRGGKVMKATVQRAFRDPVSEDVIPLPIAPLPVALTNHPASAQLSIADELAKLAKLKADGIITQAEFDDQKSKLLNK